MSTLRIGRLNTRIREMEAEQVAAMDVLVRGAVAGPLADNLVTTAARAQARAGLPAEAVVAIRRLPLRLQLLPGVDGADLARGWAMALETALVRALAASPPATTRQSAGREATGREEDAAELVWFMDRWSAEQQHLQRLARGLPASWWAVSLAGAADGPIPPVAATILPGWLERSPARALALMAELALLPGVIGLLSDTAARRLTAQLLSLFAAGGSGSPPASSTLPPAALASPTTASNEPAAAELAREERSLIRATLRREAPWLLPEAAGSAGVFTASQPWLLALALQRHPAIARRSAEALHWLLEETRTLEPAPPLPLSLEIAAATPQAATQEPVRPEAASLEDPAGLDNWRKARVDAGGLLLLIRPLRTPAVLAEAELPQTLLGDLALLALRRLLAPLPRAEREVTLERQRSLLELLAPDRPWAEPLASEADSSDPTTAAALAALMERIPAAIAFAPGAVRQVYGSATAPLAEAGEHRLARLLWRPGLLRLSPWEAELHWPASSADGAIRRLGWDLDPGWVSGLGRTIRFHFGEEP